MAQYSTVKSNNSNIDFNFFRIPVAEEPKLRLEDPFGNSAEEAEKSIAKWDSRCYGTLSNDTHLTTIWTS